MTFDERTFVMALRQFAERTPQTQAPTAHVLRRAQRLRRGRSAVLAGTALVALLLAAVAALGAGSSGGMPADRFPLAGPGAVSDTPDTPDHRLILAAQQTAARSFRFQLTDRGDSARDGEPPESWNNTYVGAFDPVGPKGYLIRDGENGWREETRLLGRDVYSGHRLNAGGPTVWKDFRDNRSLLTFVLDLSSTSIRDVALDVDPAAQIESLKRLGTITPLGTSGTGAAAIERYTFRYIVTTTNPKDTDQPATTTVSGAIEVSVAARNLKSFTYNATMIWSNPVNMTAHSAVTWSYSDYGSPVEVQAPAPAPAMPSHR